MKAEASFKSNRSEYASRIFDKTESVQHADHFIVQISLPTVEIQYIAEALLVQPDRQGIDRKVTTIEIFFNRTVLYRR